jgi:ElaB/YqjD/DUF883 family membrane-anchored ribosome-binding protein
MQMDMSRISEEAKQVEDYAKQRLSELGDTAEQLVRHHPWQALGVIAAVGVVVGVLLGKRLK